MTEQFTMIILLIALGYFLKRINFIKATDSQVIATLVLNVTLPSLVIVNLNSAELKLSFSILPILMIIYGIVAKMIAVWFFRKYDNHMRGSVGMMTGAMNIGLFAYPLIEVIWPKTGLIYFVMADIGGAFVMFGITYFVGSYFSEGSDQFDFKYLGKKIITISATRYIHCNVYIEYKSHPFTTCGNRFLQHTFPCKYAVINDFARCHVEFYSGKKVYTCYY